VTTSPVSTMVFLLRKEALLGDVAALFLENILFLVHAVVLSVAALLEADHEEVDLLAADHEGDAEVHAKAGG